jgi:hypothetical protein
MSSPILPIEGPSGPYSPTSTASQAGADADAFRSVLAASERTLAIEVARSGPAPEVLEQIAAAGRIYDELRESGRELRFHVGQDGRVTIDLADTEKNTVRTVSVAEALEITAGKSLE